MLRFLSRRVIVVLWLGLLAIYVLAGVPVTSFHGDEPMQIYMSHDYATAFIDRNLEPLTDTGPYNIDSDVQLRILNGSVNRYAIGLGWHLAGFSRDDLPPAPGWDWGLDYDTNVATDHRPSDGLLNASRASSALFLALSVWVVFGIGWQMGGVLPAYLASGLYALNPVVLINGRRAMMEGSLLFFGLLTIFMAVTISRKLAHGGRGLWLWWLGLILSGGLAIASKHSGVVFVGGALGWIFITALLRWRWRDLAVTVFKLAVSGVLICLLFIALSPALWTDTPARLEDLVNARSELIDIQVNADPNAPMSTEKRIEQIIVQPFMTAPAHFEAGGWTDFSVISEEIGRYMASPLSGVQFGPIIGALLMLLAVAGIGVVIARQPVYRAGILVWLAATLAMLMVNPLPWQRYYLPLIPILTLLAALGVAQGVAFFVHRPEQDHPKEPLVTEDVRPQTIR